MLKSVRNTLLKPFSAISLHTCRCKALRSTQKQSSTTLSKEKKSSIFHLSFFKAMTTRGVIGDKWSMRILWVCAIGSVIGLYMVAVERQRQNRDRMMAESLNAMESEGSGDQA
ncbi:hypothetical protein CRYUN_Cryun25bG0027500 [Craigia yunnanensis]